MDKFYVGYSQAADSYSVFESGRKNEFGERYCIEPMTTRFQAEAICSALNQGKTIREAHQEANERYSQIASW